MLFIFKLDDRLANSYVLFGGIYFLGLRLFNDAIYAEVAVDVQGIHV